MAAAAGQTLRSYYEAQVREWLDLKMVTGRYSSILVGQLAQHIEQRTVNVFAIYDEVEALERPDIPRATRTKPAAPLKGALLRGLWHKHHFQAAYLLQNLRNQWPEAKVAVLVETVAADATMSDDVKAGRIAHEIVLGGYQAQAQARKITGEWIIYAKHSDRNYYLTLGDHGEDAAIASRALACNAEFPELQGTWG